MESSATTAAQEILRTVNARITRPRVAVLAELLAAPHALTHHEVAARVRRSLHVDRVTIYRVLDWLVEKHLAHRIAGDDRVWRYNAVADVHLDDHVHFKCNRCGRVTCLDEEVRNPQLSLPPGFRSQQVEITVKGLCAECPQEKKRRKAR
jgi:Fur family ferric uptake transcriptional regulator